MDPLTKYQNELDKENGPPWIWEDATHKISLDKKGTRGARGTLHFYVFDTPKEGIKGFVLLESDILIAHLIRDEDYLESLISRMCLYLAGPRVIETKGRTIRYVS